MNASRPLLSEETRDCKLQDKEERVIINGDAHEEEYEVGNEREIGTNNEDNSTIEKERSAIKCGSGEEVTDCNEEMNHSQEEERSLTSLLALPSPGFRKIWDDTVRLGVYRRIVTIIITVSRGLERDHM